MAVGSKFSVFGNILTKLRNRTGNSVVVDISQAKMHIRDEHVSGREMKIRLKRRFEADGAAQKSAQTDSYPSRNSYVPPVDEVIHGHWSASLRSLVTDVK